MALIQTLNNSEWVNNCSNEENQIARTKNKTKTKNRSFSSTAILHDQNQQKKNQKKKSMIKLLELSRRKKKECEILREEVHKLEQNNNQVSKRNKILCSENGNLKQDLQETKNGLREKDRQNEKLKKQNEEYEQKMDHLLQTNKRNAQKTKKTEMKTRLLEKEVEKLEEELFEMKKRQKFNKRSTLSQPTNKVQKQLNQKKTINVYSQLFESELNYSQNESQSSLSLEMYTNQILEMQKKQDQLEKENKYLRQKYDDLLCKRTNIRQIRDQNNNLKSENTLFKKQNLKYQKKIEENKVQTVSKIAYEILLEKSNQLSLALGSVQTKYKDSKLQLHNALKVSKEKQSTINSLTKTLNQQQLIQDLNLISVDNLFDSIKEKFHLNSHPNNNKNTKNLFRSFGVEKNSLYDELNELSELNKDRVKKHKLHSSIIDDNRNRDISDHQNRDINDHQNRNINDNQNQNLNDNQNRNINDHHNRNINENHNQNLNKNQNQNQNKSHNNNQNQNKNQNNNQNNNLINNYETKKIRKIEIIEKIEKIGHDNNLKNDKIKNLRSFLNLFLYSIENPDFQFSFFEPLSKIVDLIDQFSTLKKYNINTKQNTDNPESLYLETLNYKWGQLDLYNKQFKSFFEKYNFFPNSKLFLQIVQNLIHKIKALDKIYFKNTKPILNNLQTIKSLFQSNQIMMKK
ncbi:hypothetical protein M0812_09233 [Anaeramoeba flamelloides]|uniref:Uncharacterized protein n=1 Tax=Anaeramoeba flamelloides TaxID=1746091 RepID=A0AAV7ZTU7_9EUKA|nr:hypothetical protein M0812_09233 [Anaeramoeba flamelloides]